MSENYNETYEEIDLMELIMILVKKKWLIVLLALGAMVAAFIASNLMSPEYEATLSLRVREPFVANILLTPSYEPNQAASTTSPSLKSALIPEKPPVEEIVRMFQSPSIMREIQETYGANSWEAIRSRLSIEAPSKTNMIVLKATGDSPESSVSLVTTWAKIATDRYHAQVEETLHATFSELSSKYSSSKIELDNILAEIVRFNEENNIQTLLAQLEVLTTSMVEYQNEMQELAIQINELESKVNSYRESLSRNTVSQEIVDALVENESALAAAKARRKAIEPIFATMDQQVKDLQVQLATKQAAEQQLRSRMQQIEATHSSLSKKYEQVRLLQSVPLSYFQVIGEPIPPEHPIKPRTLLNVAIAGVLGVFVGIGLAFFLEYFEDYKKRQANSETKVLSV